MALFLHLVHYLCFTRDTSLCSGFITSVQEWNCQRKCVLVSVHTLAKANINVDLAKSKPYAWTSCEERKWDLGKNRVSMAHANGMITLEESEVRA